MPYQSIDKNTYQEMKDALGKLNFGRIKGEEIIVERFCDNDVCEIDFTPSKDNSDEEVVDTIDVSN